MKIFYNKDGWVCERYPYNLSIDDENRYIEVNEEEYEKTLFSPIYYAWAVVDGKLISKHYSELSSEEKEEEEKYNNVNLNEQYIPNVDKSMKLFVKTYLKSNPPKDTEEKIQLSGLYDEWKPSNYKVGDIVNYLGQTWECHQAHDNSVFPDIKPSNAQTWATFWKPLHATTKETARLWCKPCAGTTDMYHAGEFMIYTDSKIYKCISDTVYSPEEYAQAWEVVNE